MAAESVEMGQRKRIALVAHDHVAEAAAVGYPHDVKGQGIYVYVSLYSGMSDDEGGRVSCS